MTKTRAKFQLVLNNEGAPDHELEVNGGRLKEGTRYGTWLRRNDPIQYGILFKEWKSR